MASLNTEKINTFRKRSCTNNRRTWDHTESVHWKPPWQNIEHKKASHTRFCLKLPCVVHTISSMKHAGHYLAE